MDRLSIAEQAIAELNAKHKDHMARFHTEQEVIPAQATKGTGKPNKEAATDTATVDEEAS
jgi:hypothetical protein